jgi:superfamily I DNA/RNA helicase
MRSRAAYGDPDEERRLTYIALTRGKRATRQL